MNHSHKPRKTPEIREDTHQHTRGHELRTQRHTRAFEGMIVDSGVDKPVDKRDTSVVVATTEEGCCSILFKEKSERA